ncbi:MAG: CRTAC1 family protein, partial [Rubripirellula sp.]
CHPLRFPAERDQFLGSTEQGELRDVTEEWGVQTSPGRGLGVLAGLFDGESMGFYVANDMSSNFYFMLETDSEDQSTLVDSATARGLALDGRTMAQASMGVAASDLDGDGDLDFYVTGFAREYNIYYEQTLPGIWKDRTNRMGLITPTLSVVGFGTQAVDLDGDGIQELIVTNGHIGHFDEPDSLPYAQPMQLFRRGGDGTFSLVDIAPWGKYFANDHVGRALWTIDVDCDGREDMMVTHNAEQVGLLMNRSDDRHDRVAFRLVGTDVARDATGAIIRFECNGKERTLWMLSGDGYLCSNERTLRAGLGDAKQIANVRVTWQDGTTDSFGDLKSNSEYLLVQGQDEAYLSRDYK